MAAVAVDRNYTIRVAGTDRGDEIGRLSAGFNEMLGEIAIRDEALATHRDTLEQQVLGAHPASCRPRRSAPRTPAAPRASSSPT